MGQFITCNFLQTELRSWETQILNCTKFQDETTDQGKCILSEIWSYWRLDVVAKLCFYIVLNPGALLPTK